MHVFFFFLSDTSKKSDSRNHWIIAIFAGLTLIHRTRKFYYGAKDSTAIALKLLNDNSYISII